MATSERPRVAGLNRNFFGVYLDQKALGPGTVISYFPNGPIGPSLHASVTSSYVEIKAELKLERIKSVRNASWGTIGFLVPGDAKIIRVESTGEYIEPPDRVGSFRNPPNYEERFWPSTAIGAILDHPVTVSFDSFQDGTRIDIPFNTDQYRIESYIAITTRKPIGSVLWNFRQGESYFSNSFQLIYSADEGSRPPFVRKGQRPTVSRSLLFPGDRFDLGSVKPEPAPGQLRSEEISWWGDQLVAAEGILVDKRLRTLKTLLNKMSCHS